MKPQLPMSCYMWLGPYTLHVDFFPTAMQLGFNLWAWTWCNISRPRKSGTLGGGTGGACGTRCPGTFAFLEPKEFLELVEPVKRMGPTGSKHSLGSNTQWFHRFHTGSTQVPHRFQTGSLGSTRPLVPQVPDRFLGFNHAMVSQLPDRFLGFKKSAVPQVPCIPWVQQRTGSTGFRTGSLGSNTQWFHRFHTGSLGSTRHWFHSFQTGSLGSTTPWNLNQVPCRFLGFNHATGSTGFQTGSLGSTVELWELFRV